MVGEKVWHEYGFIEAGSYGPGRRSKNGSFRAGVNLIKSVLSGYLRGPTAGRYTTRSKGYWVLLCLCSLVQRGNVLQVSAFLVGCQHVGLKVRVVILP